MWTPAIGRDRRIALQDRSTRFFGTDFSFEDLEERDAGQYDYKLTGEEAIAGAPCWRIEARPAQTKTSQYTLSRIWIRKDNYVPAQYENFIKDQPVRRLEQKDIQNIQGIWTAAHPRDDGPAPQKPHRAAAGKTGVQRPVEGRRFHRAGAAPRTVIRGHTDMPTAPAVALLRLLLALVCVAAAQPRTSRSAASSKPPASFTRKPRPTIAPTRWARRSSATKPSTSSPTCASPPPWTCAPILTSETERDLRRLLVGPRDASVRSLPCAASAPPTRAAASRCRPASNSSAGARPTCSPPPTASPPAISQRGGLRISAHHRRARHLRHAGRHARFRSSAPRLTPSRIPLLNQRWAVLPPDIPVHELDPDFPGGPQFGARWNHIGAVGRVLILFLQRLRPSAALPRAAQFRALARRRAALLSADAHVWRRCGGATGPGHAEGRGRVLHFHQSAVGRIRALGAAIGAPGR